MATSVGYIGVGTRSSFSAAATATPALPANITAGNLLIAHVAVKSNDTISTPSGWTKINQTNSGTGFTSAVYWKIAASGQAAPVFTWATSVAGFAQVIAYRANTATPIGASSAAAGTGTTHASTAITTTAANSTVIYLDAGTANTAIATPSGWTENFDAGSATGTTRNAGGKIDVATSGGSSGAISVVGAAGVYVQHQIELKSDASAPTILYQSDTLTTGWTTAADTVTTGVADPDGTLVASRITDNAGTARQTFEGFYPPAVTFPAAGSYVIQADMLATGPAAISRFVNAVSVGGDRGLAVDLKAGTVLRTRADQYGGVVDAYGCTSLGGGWFTVWMAFTLSAAGNINSGNTYSSIGITDADFGTSWDTTQTFANQTSLTATRFIVSQGTAPIARSSGTTTHALTATGIATSAPQVGTPALNSVAVAQTGVYQNALTGVAASYNVALTGIGTPTADRYVVVAAYAYAQSGTVTGSGATIGGVAATLLKRQAGSAGGLVEVWGALVPTGTTANFAVTYSANVYQIDCIAYAVTGAGTSPTVTAGGSSTAGAPSVTLAVPANGAAIAFDWGQSATNLTWTGATEAIEFTPLGGTQRFGAAAFTTTSAVPSKTISVAHDVSAETAMAVVVFAPASSTTTHALTATGIASTTPVVGTPALGQKHTLTGTGIAGSTPIVGAAALGTTYSFTASSVTSTAPSVGSPALGTTNVLTASPVATSAPQTTTPLLGQAHALAASAVVSSTPQVGGPAIGQKHAVTATFVASTAPAVSTPSLGQKHALAATGLVTSIPALGVTSLGQSHALAAQPVVTSAPQVGTPSTTPTFAFTAVAVVSSTPQAGTPVLAQTHVLAVASATTSTPAAGNPALGQTHALGSPLGIATSTPVAGFPGIGQKHALTGVAVVPGTPVVGNAVAGVVGQLSANPVTSSTPQIGTPPLGQIHNLGSPLAVVGSTPATDLPIMRQINALAGQPIVTSMPATGAPAMGQKHTLAPAGVASLTPQVGSPALSQSATLVAQAVVTGLPGLGAPNVGQTHQLAAGMAVTAPLPVLGLPGLAQTHGLQASGVTTAGPAVSMPGVGQVHRLNPEDAEAEPPSVGMPMLHSGRGDASGPAIWLAI